MDALAVTSETDEWWSKFWQSVSSQNFDIILEGGGTIQMTDLEFCASLTEWRLRSNIIDLQEVKTHHVSCTCDIVGRDLNLL